MKTYDLGIVTGLVVLALAFTSIFLHKHTKECPAGCSVAEEVAESTIDNILHVPNGTSFNMVALLED